MLQLFYRMLLSSLENDKIHSEQWWSRLTSFSPAKFSLKNLADWRTLSSFHQHSRMLLNPQPSISSGFIVIQITWAHGHPSKNHFPSSLEARCAIWPSSCWKNLSRSNVYNFHVIYLKGSCLSGSSLFSVLCRLDVRMTRQPRKLWVPGETPTSLRVWLSSWNRAPPYMWEKSSYLDHWNFVGYLS